MKFVRNRLIIDFVIAFTEEDRKTDRQTDRQTDKNYKDPPSHVGGGPKNVEACCLSIMHNIWLSKLSKNKLLKVS